jgi:hypothetical protein
MKNVELDIGKTQKPEPVTTVIPTVILVKEDQQPIVLIVLPDFTYMDLNVSLHAQMEPIN